MVADGGGRRAQGLSKSLSASQIFMSLQESQRETRGVRVLRHNREGLETQQNAAVETWGSGQGGDLAGAHS